jgi:hypothetical protein
MTVKDFYQRLNANAGADREIGHWKIIDIHQIPNIVLAQHEVDFYCCNDKEVFLLRLRNRTTKKLDIVKPKKEWEQTTYLIAELPINVIDDNLIKTLLAEFSKMR